MKKTKENYDFDLILPKEVFDKQQKELRKKIIKSKSKQLKQEKILNVIVFLLIILIIGMLLFANKKLQNNFMNSCQKNGHSYIYCLEHS